MRASLASLIIAATAAGLAPGAQAQEVVLRGVSSFAENSFYSRRFEKFIERVNDEGKGVLRINYIGGPKAMPPFEVGNALQERRRRHRQRHRRLLHQRHAGGRRLEAHRTADGGAAQERRLRLHGRSSMPRR